MVEQDFFSDAFPEASQASSSDFFSEAFPEFASADRSRSGVDIGTRVAANTKVTSAGKLSYLRAQLGANNVLVDPKDGSIYIRDPKDNTLRPFDPSPEGATKWETVKSFLSDLPGDIADLGADLAEGLVGAGGAAAGAAMGAAAGGLGAIPGALIGGMLGDAGANIARQATSAAMPGSDQMSPVERIGMVGANVALGTAGEGATRLAAKAWDFVRPHNLLARPMKEGAKPEYIAEGEQLIKDTGVELDAAQVTGSRSALKLKGMLAQRGGSEQVIFDADLQRAKQLETYLNKQIERMGGSVGAEGAGERVATAYDAYMRDMVRARSQAAKSMFDEAHVRAGGQRIIPLRNTLREIDALIEDFSPDVGADTADKVVAGLGAIKQRLLETAQAGVSKEELAKLGPEQIAGRVRSTPKGFQRSLAIFGEASSGTGNIVKDVDDRATQRHVARRIFDALRTDLEEAAMDAGATGQAAQALVSARDAYREMSQGIDEARKSVLAKTIDLRDIGAADKVVPKLLGKDWSDAQVREAMKLLHKIDPLVARQARAAALEAIIGGAESSGALAAQGAAVSPAKFAAAAQRYDSRIIALFGGDAEGLVNFKKAVSAARRIQDTAGVGPGGSQTATMLWYRELFNAARGGNISWQAAPGAALGMFTARKLALALNSPEGRKQLLTIIQTGPKKQAAATALERLLYIQKREELLLGSDRQQQETPTE